MWPGVSRSLVTIVAALLVGLTLPAAVEFSFLLGLATLSAASLYEMAKHGSEVIDTFGWVSPIVGIIAAFVAAVIAIKWLVDYLNHHDLSIFGYYRIVVGSPRARAARHEHDLIDRRSALDERDPEADVALVEQGREHRVVGAPAEAVDGPVVARDHLGDLEPTDPSISEAAVHLDRLVPEDVGRRVGRLVAIVGMVGIVVER